METFMGIMLLTLGLCFGSFVNMLVYRVALRYGLNPCNPLQKGVKINNQRSVCDFCGKQLRWYENIPVISWMMQGGKSRCCAKKLSPLYPLVELTTGVLFVINGTNWWGMIAITLLIFSAVFDLRYMILPDFSSYILIGLAIVKILVDRNWLGLGVGAASYLFIFLLTKIKIKGRQAMGDGDAPLAAFMGLWLGGTKVIVAFYMAFIVGAVAGVAMMKLRGRKLSEAIPFGPFLILGTLFSWWWGETVIKLIIPYL